MDIFIDKHRILCMHRLTVAYVATNIDLGYLTQLLAFRSPSEAEAFFVKLGCVLQATGAEGATGTGVGGGLEKKKLMCKDSMPALKRAPLKYKEKVK